MSIKPNPDTGIPEETRQVAKSAFPKGNVYLWMRDELGELYKDDIFAGLYPEVGQPALSPGKLGLVTIMQFMEGMSDRQAADAVRARIDWKYALGMKLNDPGFDFSVLSAHFGDVDHRIRSMAITREGKRAGHGIVPQVIGMLRIWCESPF